MPIRGGYRKWSAAVHGVGFDCYVAYAVENSDASRFVACHRSLKQSGGWTIRLHGDEQALVLCRAWIHRHLYLLSHWLGAGGGEGYVFPADVLRAYVEPEELTALASKAEGALLDRIKQLRLLKPE